MATEMKLWQVSKDELVAIKDVQLEDTDRLETELESWIVKKTEILGEDLLVIDRQRIIEGVGRLDLLCINQTGVLVIVELKRGSAPREAVAQALDYASWLDGATDQQIQDYAQQYLGKPLAEEFTKHFQLDDMPEVVCQNHRIILAAPRLDTSAERIIKYLAVRYKVNIDAVFFKYARLVTGEEILVRSVLVADESKDGRKEKKAWPTVAELLELAEGRQVTPLVKVCRQMNTVWNEEPSTTFDKSFVYSLTTNAGWRSLYGIIVACERRPTPAGELEVWVVKKNVAEVTSLDEDTIRHTLSTGYPVEEWAQKIIIRLRTVEQAEKLIQQLQAWAATSIEAIAGHSEGNQ